jgi:hypothetical protein
MKPEAAGSNGIGALVRQYVHERNAARKAEDATPTTAPVPSSDTVELSAAAMARFEVWKARHLAPAADPVTPETEAPATEPVPILAAATQDVISALSILV